MEFNELANRVVDCALKVLSQLDPKLLELPYEQCLSPLRALRCARQSLADLVDWEVSTM